VFSGVVNVLQLTVSLYMMQVFDRVLSTRNLNTLLYLTLIAIAALALLAVLEGARSRVMQRIGAWVEECVAPEGFGRAVESELRGRPYRMEALRDLGVCRGFLSSPSVLALYDVPWVPAYLLVIFLLHPLLGIVALAGAALLFGMTVFSEVATSKLLRQANSAAMSTQRRADESIVAQRRGDRFHGHAAGRHGALAGRVRRDVGAEAQGDGPRRRRLLALTKFLRRAVQVASSASAPISFSTAASHPPAPHESPPRSSWAAPGRRRAAHRRVEAARAGAAVLKRLQAFLMLPRLRPPGIPLPAPKGRLSVETVTFGIAGSGIATIRA